LTSKPTSSIQDDIFYEKLCKLAEASIKLFKEEPKTRQFTRPMLRMRRFSEHIKYEVNEIPSYELQISSDLRFYALDELKDCVEVIKNDTILKKHYEKLIKIGNQSSVFFSIQTLTSMCSKALEDSQKGLNFRTNLIESYQNLKRFLYSSTLPVITNIPISNMKLNREIKIDHDILIKKVSLSEKQEFLNAHFLPNAIPNVLYKFDALLVLRYTINKIFDVGNGMNGADNSDVSDLYVKCMNYALELIKEGCFDFIGIFKHLEFDIPEASVGINSIGITDTCFGKPYDFDRIKSEKLNNTFNRILKLIKHDTVQNALTWLDYYTKESTLHKRVIFVTIVVETLFTKPGETDLITHKISTRIARLIGRSLNEKENIYEDLKRFYNLRSRILHGEDVSDRNKNEETVNSCIDYIREAINTLIIKANKFDDGQSFIDGHSKFLRELDLR
jgi:hypothetical protein